MLDHVKIAKYVKDTLLDYFSEGVDSYADYLLEPPEKDMEELFKRTAGWGSSCDVVRSEAPDGLVGDEFRFSTNYQELDEEGEVVGNKEYEVNITFRVVSVTLRDCDVPRDDDAEA